MRIVFLGTPDFATVVLESLISSNHEVVAVVTQPDKLVGRKQRGTFQGDTHRRESVPELLSRCHPYYTLVHGRGLVNNCWLNP